MKKIRIVLVISFLLNFIPGYSQDSVVISKDQLTFINKVMVDWDYLKKETAIQDSIISHKDSILSIRNKIIEIKDKEIKKTKKNNIIRNIGYGILGLLIGVII